MIEDHDPDVVVCLLQRHSLHLLPKYVWKCSRFHDLVSYVKQDLRELPDGLAKKKGYPLLCEMGLDPGIDHMSACKTISEIHSEGPGKVASGLFAVLCRILRITIILSDIRLLGSEQCNRFENKGGLYYKKREGADLFRR